MSQTEAVRVRFAPSPTGMLHVGGARTAIYNWAFARAQRGTFILRIEDTDPARSTEENTQIILRAMRWLGLDWDEGPEIGGSVGPYFQTQRSETYTRALEQLKTAGKVYPCFCTKEELEAKREAAGESYCGYDRSCRSLSPEQAQERIDTGEEHVWRLKVPKDHGAIEFDDAVYGHMSFPAEVMDDMILIRSDGTPTYNFAVVCDDVNMGITHVIRGDDHLSNTPRQVLIYEALGAKIPQFAHLSMILGADGKKLSKRHGATSVEEYAQAGYTSDCMVNFLALLGWSLDGETTMISRDELCNSFSLERVTKKDAIFDEQKLNWMNGQYIQAMGAARWVKEAETWLNMAGAENSSIDLEKVYPLVSQRLERFDQIPEKLSYLFSGSSVELDTASVEKVLLKEGSRADEALKACRKVLADETITWECDPLQNACKELCTQLDMKAKNLFQPLRVAICGNMVSPPLFESIELMNRSDVVSRIDSALHEVFGV